MEKSKKKDNLKNNRIENKLQMSKLCPFEEMHKM
jgi:hypothetical protein